MHFWLLDKANFLEKEGTSSSGIYIGKRTFYGLQASLEQYRGIQDTSSLPGVRSHLH